MNNSLDLRNIQLKYMFTSKTPPVYQAYETDYKHQRVYSSKNPETPRRYERVTMWMQKAEDLRPI